MLFIIFTALFSIVSIFLIYRWLGATLSVAIISIKFGIPLIFYLFFQSYIPEFNAIHYDRWLEQTRPILAEGHTPLSILIDNFEPIERSRPFYWWWTAIWITLIDNSVYGPILANIFITVVGSVFATLILSELEFSIKYQKWFLIFSLLQWDILTWSTLLNHREKVMATFTIIAFYLIIKFLRSNDWKIELTCVIFLIPTLWTIRLNRDYLLVVILVTVALWIVLEIILFSRNSNYTIILFSPLALLASLRAWFEFSDEFYQHFSLGELPRGVYRYIIGPTFWDLNPEFGWLFPSLLLHWLIMPIALLGFILKVRDRHFRLLFIYAFLLTFIYSSTAESISPQRFRFQLVFILSFIQFGGLWYLYHKRSSIKIRLKK